MSLAVLTSRALSGLQAHAVRVEVHVGAGLPAFHLVGLPGADVRESRERVRSAIVNSGFEFPAGRITANLAPAELPKESGRFDLPIALGVLLASGQVAAPGGEAPDLRAYVFAGELSLTGAITAAGAPLAIALQVARSAPGAILVLPPDAASVAAQVPGLTVLQAGTLSEVVGHFSGAGALDAAIAPVPAALDPAELPCLSDVRGQVIARRALEIAAAGRHSLLMCGPPGVGKSMLAQRLPGILPRLPASQALEVAAVLSAGGLECVHPGAPPFRAPHHSASMAALVGGGVRPRPGEISLAHHGVLFLDELPEFERRALEALREPLETGHVSIARAAGTCRFPADFQLVAAMNPCPCGWRGHPRRDCRCTPERIERYRARLSGPLLDRIDLHLALASEEVWAHAPAGEPSAQVRRRVARARRIQLERQGVPNAALKAAALQRHARLDDVGLTLLAEAGRRWAWSARGAHRVLRVALTIADLAEAPGVRSGHLAEAMRYRPETS
ncbi:YifB family Mg chelatase-like AAA ATPase [Castellaniella sp. GW247-6E4]|uniref:YifB family Mg chelatase-like AAA ATPase n=1 Tax=Castellaniella sp. GW247-6E4 TaxID=3140380 RepID=UPI0033150A72